MRRLESRWRVETPKSPSPIVVAVSRRPAIAQESRSEERAGSRSEKPLAANVPSGGERFFDWLEDYLTEPGPWVRHVRQPDAELGICAGPGYRGVLGDVARFNVRGAWSVRNYTLGEGVVEIPFADERFEVGWSRDAGATAASFRSTAWATTRRKRNVRSYALQTVDLGGSATWRPSRWFQHRRRRVGHAGREQRRRRALPFDRNGLRSEYRAGPAGPARTTCTLEATAAIDWRESEGYTRSGGYYAVTFHRYDDRSDDLYTFNEVEADVRQFIPLLNEHWVFALRGQLRTTDLDSGQQVPYLHASRPRWQHDPARLSRRAVQGSARDAPERRVPMDSRAGTRHGALLRCRQGRGPAKGSRLRGSQDLLRHRRAVSRAIGHRSARWKRRTGARAIEFHFAFGKSF